MKKTKENIVSVKPEVVDYTRHLEKEGRHC
jgi:hypothetical protein